MVATIGLWSLTAYTDHANGLEDDEAERLIGFIPDVRRTRWVAHAVAESGP